MSSPYVDAVVAGLERARNSIRAEEQGTLEFDDYDKGKVWGLDRSIDIIDDLIRELNDVR